MTIEEAIKKAIKGGYDCQGITRNPDSEIDIDYETQRDGSKRVIVSTKKNVSAGGYRELIQEKFFLDPNFWKCLGKSLGWEQYARDEATRRDNPSIEMPTLEWEYQGARAMYSWEFQWHQFINTLVEGKTPEDYFKTLNKEKTG